MSGDPQDDFEQAFLDDALDGWRASTGETVAQAAVVVVLGVPILVLCELVQCGRRVARWARLWPVSRPIVDVTEPTTVTLRREFDDIVGTPMVR